MEQPLCKCGCGQQVEWSAKHARWRAFVTGHRYKDHAYKDADWLRYQYCDLKRSAEEIAKEFGVNKTSVIGYMQKFGIERRNASESKIGRFSGEKNPAWKGGVSKWQYAPAWKRIMRSIRKRDDYTCQMCGEQHPTRSKTLHVHHIDGDKTNNDPSNLMTVCATCHPRGKRKEKYNPWKDPLARVKWLVTRKGEVLGYDADKYLMAAEVRKALKVTHDVVTDLIKAGVLVGQKIGGFWYVERESFEQFAPKYTPNKHHRKYT